MPSRRGPRRDYSTQKGNPTAELQKAYTRLMSIQDPDELAQAAISIVKPLVGSGISEQNFRKFMNNLKQSSERGLQGIQFYLSNYILSGSGMSVESKEKAIASMITEDINEIRRLTPQQQRLKALVESYGYHVAVY